MGKVTLAFAAISWCALTALAEPVTIMPMGDSITAGVPVPGGYRELLYNRLIERFDVDFVGQLDDNDEPSAKAIWHEGHGGHNTQQIRFVVGDSLLANKPDIVLLMTGSNLVDDFETHLNALLNDINYRGQTRDLFIATVPMSTNDERNAYLESENTYIRTLPATWQVVPEAPLMRVHLVEIEPLINTELHLSDWVHPNLAGYEVIADAWYDAMTSISPVGDVNLDFSVDLFDVATVSNRWGESGPYGDANLDGAVDIFDVATISQNWSQQGPQSVPEPSTLAAGAIAGFLLLLLRKKLRLLRAG